MGLGLDIQPDREGAKLEVGAGLGFRVSLCLGLGLGFLFGLGLWGVGAFWGFRV